MPQASRGKLQACIKAGNVSVNGKPELKTSLTVRPGDDIQCVLLDAPVIQAIPEVHFHVSDEVWLPVPEQHTCQVASSLVCNTFAACLNAHVL